jgi:hypothetical protein
MYQKDCENIICIYFELQIGSLLYRKQFNNRAYY